MTTTVECIAHYQTSIGKALGNDTRLLHCMSKLYKLPISVKDLQETGIGRTVNSLRKYDGAVGIAAKALVMKWKSMVASAEESGSEGLSEDEPDDDTSKPKDNDYSQPEEATQNLSSPTTDKTQKLTSSHHKRHHKHSNSKHETCVAGTSSKHSRSSNERSSSSSKHHSSSSKKDKEKEKEIETSKHRSSSSSSSNNKNKHSESDKNKTSSHESRSSTKTSNSHSKRKRSHSTEEQKESSKRDKKESTSSTNRDSRSEKKSEKSEGKSKEHRKSDSKHHSSKSNKYSNETKISGDSDSKEKVSRAVEDDDEEFDNQGMGFADMLAMCDQPKSSKKLNGLSDKLSKPASPVKSLKQPSSLSEKQPKASTSVPFSSFSRPLSALKAPPSLLTKRIALNDLSPDITREIVTITNDYKPLPLNTLMMDCLFSTNNKAPKKNMTDEELLTDSFSSKANRTKVFSGNKTYRGDVMSLYDMCIRLLQENIDSLEFTGGVPFDILKPILERATPDQLSQLEYHNPYLIDDSDILWEPHCKRHFRAKKREEMESFREMYMRCMDEQNDKLMSVTKIIRQSQKTSQLPIKKTKMAFVDSAVKPPRSVMSQQSKYGTNHKLIASPAARVSSLSNVTGNLGKVGDARLRVASGLRDTAQVSSIQSMKPRKAPMMAKALQLLKGSFKRR